MTGAEIAALLRERDAARAQRDALAEVLRAIAASPDDPQPVFDLIARQSCALLGAMITTVTEFSGTTVHFRAIAGVDGETEAQLRRTYPRQATEDFFQGRVLLRNAAVHCRDVARDSTISASNKAVAARLGYNSNLGVPIRGDRGLVGGIVAVRRETGGFDDSETALLEAFADQAAIAIDNARARREERDALARQTATAEVLAAIAASPDDPQPVFDTILSRAVALCGAEQASISSYDGTMVDLPARLGFDALADQQPFYPRPAEMTDMHGRVVLTGATIHLRDLAAGGGQFNTEVAALLGTRSILGVPLRREGRAIGAIVLRRTVPGGFADAQVALVEGFAEQAAIAIESARARREEREALERQTATAEILAVINANPGDVAPVFAAMLERAMRLCGVAYGSLYRFDGENFHSAAHRGLPEAFVQYRSQGPIPPTPGSIAARMLAARAPVQTADITADPEYRSGGATERAIGELGGVRAMLLVPLLREGEVVGMITLSRPEPVGFAAPQVALLQDFAAQAVIAIENARLLTEQREALERQTATAEVLAAINANPGSLAPVFDTILAAAHRMCGVAKGALLLCEGNSHHAVATHGYSPEADAHARTPRPVPQFFADMAAGRTPYHHADVTRDTDHDGWSSQHGRRSIALTGIRTYLAVPLVKDGHLRGVITAVRTEVRPFAERDIALLQSFADQAVIAIENARLITEQREALEQQKAAADILTVISTSMGDVQPVFDKILESCKRLFDGDELDVLLVDEQGMLQMAAYVGRFRDQVLATFPAPVDITPAGPAIRERRVVHYADVINDPATPPVLRRIGLVAGYHAVAFAPMVWQDKGIGVVGVARARGAFSDGELAVLQSFAAQAVIAVQNTRLITEQREALERQTAMAEVLEVINTNPGHLAPVFDALLDKAMRLCGVSFGLLHTWDGAIRRTVAARGLPPAFASFIEANPGFEPPPIARQMLEQGQSVQIEDLAEVEHYKQGHVLSRAFVDLGGARTMMHVPLLKGDAAIGYVSFYRQEVRLFSPADIALLESFAAQAVVAMDNARLLTEQREALERQTAMAEVLAAINANPGNLVPVFAAILAKAHALCGAEMGAMKLYDGSQFRAVATHGYPEALDNGVRTPHAPNAYDQQLIDGARRIAIVDVAALPGDWAHASGRRSGISLPLRRDGALVGLISAYRQEVRPFSEPEIALLESFAAQAVIAIENARLLDEQREALDRQTAMAEVLAAINANPGNLGPVFDAILHKAHALCGADGGGLYVAEGAGYRLAAAHGYPADHAAELLALPPSPPNAFVNRMIETGEHFQIPDMQQERAEVGPLFRRSIELGGMRTGTAIPFHRDGRLLGYITAWRNTVRPFSETEIGLLKSFAAQASIAIENARLLDEQREALARQTAMAEVLGVINANPGHLAPVFDVLLDKATRLCEAAFGELYRYDGDLFQAVALRNVPPAYAEFRLRQPQRNNPGTFAARILAGERVIHIPDLLGSEAYRNNDPGRRAMVDIGGARSAVCVPLLNDGGIRGGIVIYRQEPRPFDDRQIALLEGFAAQAVIAMENARLLDEQREALVRQTAIAEVLAAINANPGTLAPVFDTILEHAHLLCDAPAGSLQIWDGEIYRAVADRGLPPDFAEGLRRGYRPGDLPLHRLGERGVAEQLDLEEVARAWPDDPMMRSVIDVAGLRTLLAVPLLRDGLFLGRIVAGRKVVRPFTDTQIALLESFAAQAVIAMDNARLLGELHARTAELAARNSAFAEQIDHQAATIDVLKAMSASPGDPQPVFDLIAERARAVCNADFSAVTMVDAGLLHLAAHAGDGAYARQIVMAFPSPIGASTTQGRAVLGRAPVRIADTAGDPDYAPHDLAGMMRATAAVPVLRDGVAIGAIGLGLAAPGLFSDAQIELLQTFAEQAAIAIASAETFRELQARTTELAARNRDYGERIEHQSATIDVLKAMASTPIDLQAIFEMIARRAQMLCDADASSIAEFDGELLHMRAIALHPAASPSIVAGRDAFQAQFPRRPDRDMVGGRVVLERRLVHIRPAGEAALHPTVQAMDLAAVVGVPLLRDGAPIGVISLNTKNPAGFSASQIALLETFAEQAVIAIGSVATFRELQTRTAELDARNRAFEVQVTHQAATIDVLKTMSSRPGETAPVFAAILDRAIALSGALFGSVMEFEGGMLHYRAHQGFAEDAIERFQRLFPRPLERSGLMGQAVLTGRTMYARDYHAENPGVRPEVRDLGYKALLAVPLLRQGVAIGVLIVSHAEVGAFTDSHIALLETFAEQAVIAIGAAALFRALENRTAELAARNREFAVQVAHQAATIDVLKVMSSATGDTGPVFDMILDRALELCGAKFGGIAETDGRTVELRRIKGWNADQMRDYAALFPRPFGGWRMDQAMLTGEVQLVRDVRPGQADRPAAIRALGFVSQISVPLMRDGVAIGCIAIGGEDEDSFNDSHVALLSTFAEQAVIAIGSAENFRALRSRTAELDEQVAHQAATIEVLKAMSASPGDPQPVFELIARQVRVLSRTGVSGVFEFDGELAHLRAQFGGEEMIPPAALEEFLGSWPAPLTPGSISCRAILEARTLHVTDVQADPHASATVRALGHREQLSVPMLHDGRAVGSLTITSWDPEPMRDSQIALAHAFAEQAAIALASARTFRALEQRTAELQQSLEYQAATIDVLKVMAVLTGDAQPVFETIVDRAMKLCGCVLGALVEFDGRLMHLRVWRGPDNEGAAAYRRSWPMAPSRATGPGRVILDRRMEHVRDMHTAPEVTAAARALGYRTQINLPLFRGDTVIGIITVAHQEVDAFTPAHVELLKTFAEQAVIAIGAASNYRALETRTAELQEALEHQTATAEVLGVINASQGNLVPVFEAMLDRAMRLCRVAFGTLYTWDGTTRTAVASRGLPPAYAAYLAENSDTTTYTALAQEAIATGQPQHLLDASDSPDYRAGHPRAHAVVKLGGARTLLLVPLRQDGAVVGWFLLYRQEVRAFEATEIALMESFAAQAVIAMEHARLLGALRDQTAELTRSVAELRALEEVTRAVNASLDRDTVLATIIARAVDLGEAAEGTIYEYDAAEDIFVPKANAGMTEDRIAGLRDRRIRMGQTHVGRAAALRAPVTVADVQDDPAIPEAATLLAGIHAVLAVPLLLGDRVAGGLVIRRRTGGAFAPSTVTLMQTFAAQSAIAMQNARLFNEVQARTGELAEALERQTAAADILRVINTSRGDPTPVFEVVLEKAMHLCGAAFGILGTFEDGVANARATRGVPRAYADYRSANPAPPQRLGPIGRLLRTRRTVHIADLKAEEGYREGYPLVRAVVDLGGARTDLLVPLLRDDEVLGYIAVYRQEVRPFTDQQVALLESFAAQAVLAIDNARLFNQVQARTAELTEALDMQTATADVLKAISRSAFDLDTVLETLTRSAATLCGADTGNLRIRDGDGFRLGASFGFAPRGVDYLRTIPLVPGRGSISARVAQSLGVETLYDEQADQEMDPALLRVTPNRAVLGVPLLRDGALEGVFVLGRTRPGHFSQRQIDVVRTFADQAVIAVQNARLFNEVQARTQELSRSLDELRAAQDRLVQTEKLASLGQLTAGIAHEIKNPLNFVNNFSALSLELLDELDQALTAADASLRSEIDELTGMLRGNLDKVIQHGRRADGIVRNMLLHSRERGGERRAVDFNATVEEALNLAYHGARAETPGFNVTLERAYDPEITQVELFPQEFTRVLLNLIGNGFYAATRRAAEPGFAPTISVSTQARADAVVVRVRDNGTGIPDHVRAHLFEPFFTTKPAGEGTGLGLSLSHDIIVKQHGGTIEVDTAPGRFTEFVVTIPRSPSGAPPT